MVTIHRTGLCLRPFRGADLAFVFGSSWFYTEQMAYFRVIRVRKSRLSGEEGWAVERTALGERGGIVSPIFPTKGEAKAEVDKLTAQDVGNTER